MASNYALFRERQADCLSEETYKRSLKDSVTFVQRLANTRTLQGHRGCVNTISWSSCGTNILSGSDDRHLKVFNAATKRELVSLLTSHSSNILSADFMGGAWYGDVRTVSCSSGGSVEYSETTPSGRTISNVFRCHRSVTYKVVPLSPDREKFLTCEDRGMVRLFDLRVKTECHCGGCAENVVCRFSSGVSSMAVHPTAPHYLLVGVSDGNMHLLDLRMSHTSSSATPSLSALARPVQTYSSRCGKRKFSCVQFSGDGSQILASYSGGGLYLFNSGLGSSTCRQSRFTSHPYYNRTRMDSPARKATEELPQGNIGAGFGREDSHEVSKVNSVTASSDVNRPLRKIRFRGDWSDTGPEARPSTAENPMARHLSRMLDMWLSENSNTISSASSSAASNVSSPEERGEGGGSGRRLGWLERWRRARRTRAESGERSNAREEPVERRRQTEGGRAGAGRQDESAHDRESWQDVGVASMNPVQVRSQEGSADKEASGESFNLIDSSSDEETHVKSKKTDRDQASEADHEINSTGKKPSCEKLIRTSDAGDDETLPCSSISRSDEGSVDQLSHVTTEGRGGCCKTGFASSQDDGASVCKKGIMGSDSCCDYDRDVGKDTGNVASESGNVEAVSAEGSSSSGTASSRRDHLKYESAEHEKDIASESPAAAGRTRGEAAASVGSNSVPGGSPCPDIAAAASSATSPGIPQIVVAGEVDNDVTARLQQDVVDPLPNSKTLLSGKSAASFGRVSSSTASSLHDAGVDDGGETARKCSSGHSVAVVATGEDGRRPWGGEEFVRPFMKYEGHRNARTMIKQANFLGDSWVMSGSDCGRVFVWNKWTGDIMNFFQADRHVVNCIQPHPSAYVIATSGVDYDIKLWEPTAESACSLETLSEIVERNRIMLEESRNTVTMPPAMFLRLLPYLSRRMRVGQRDTGREGED